MSLIDEIKIKSLSEAQEILKAAGSEDIFEKAHKDGDLHPNGKWVWVSSAAGGKGDWRTLNGRTHKKHQTANAAGGNGGGSSSQSSNTTKTTPSSTKQTNVKQKDESSKPKKSTLPDTMLEINGDMDEKYGDEIRPFTYTSNGVKDLTDKDKKGFAVWVGFEHKMRGRQPVNREKMENFINDTAIPNFLNEIYKRTGKKFKKEDVKIDDYWNNTDMFRIHLLTDKTDVIKEGESNKKTSTKKTAKSQTFEAQNAAAYDKGDGKIGNYAKPETRSYRADALLRMMKNNIHLGFEYGMDGKKINEELKARGDKLVTVTMHKNGDGNDIYRVKFDIDTTSKKTSSKKSAFNGNAVDAIKSSDLFGNGKLSMGDIASINIGKPDKDNGEIPATVIYKNKIGSYKSVSVTIDADGNVTKDSGWQSKQAYLDLDEAKSYVEYGRRGKNTFNLKWEDEDNSAGSKTKNDKGKTGKDFNIVGARAQDVADNVAKVLGGKVDGSEKVNVKGISGSTIKAYKVTVGNKSFFIHDGVFEKSYSARGYARYKGFTVMKADGSSVMKYKLNALGNHFTNAFSENAGELGSWIKQRWLNK